MVRRSRSATRSCVLVNPPDNSSGKLVTTRLGDPPQFRIVVTFHFVDEAAATLSDGRDDGLIAFDHASHRVYEYLRKAFHLANLVYETEG